MEEPPYPTLALSQDLGKRWPNIESARQFSNQKLAQLKDLLVDLDSDDTSIVVLGSLGRGEFTQASDIDWYLLVDGIADPHHHNLFLEADRRIKDFTQKDVGKEKTFATFVSSHNLIHDVGGEDDTNNNLTRRLLLLLESTPLAGPVTHERVVKNILKRYLLEDRSFWRADGHHIPHFLLNDLARLWRTMAVDFAYKLRARSGEKWAIRNVKLRMSRKLLYVAGLLACFHSHLLLDKPDAREQVYGDESFRPEIVEVIHSIFSDTPLDMVASLVSKLEEDEAVSQVFRAYDEFLGVLLDSDQRKHLEQLSEAAADSDPTFQKAREISHHFRDGLLDLFFGKKLYSLTRLYGVF
jgi:predicted nucleotidyltransferase